MKILVTGAGGFVGGHLIRLLLDEGHGVVAASHKSVPFPAGAASAVLDVTSLEQMHTTIALHQPDAIVHLAAQSSPRSSWEDPATTYRVNLLGASNVLEAVRAKGTLRVLLVGSAQQYGPPVGDEMLTESSPQSPSSPYGLSKVAQDMLGRMYHEEFSADVVMARAFNHTGPGQSDEYVVAAFCTKILSIERGTEPVLKVGRLDGVRDFLDVRDVVRAYLMLVEGGKSGEAYNVASGRGVKIQEILDVLLKEAGLSGKVQVKQDPTPRPGDPAVLIGDNSKIRSQVGWEPTIPLETSLGDTLEWSRRAAASKEESK